MDLRARKAIECSKLDKLFCGSLEDTNVERNTEDGVLTYKVLEGSQNITRVFV